MTTAHGDGIRMTADAHDLFDRHYLPLVRLALRLVDDQESAEDLVQDVFLSLLRKPIELDDPALYLRQAVLNRARSTLRRRIVARRFWSRSTTAELVDAADEPVLARVGRDRMLDAIRRLPLRQREAVVLRYYEDLSVIRIAEILETSPGAVSSALNRALAALAPKAEVFRHA